LSQIKPADFSARAFQAIKKKFGLSRARLDSITKTKSLLTDYCHRASDKIGLHEIHQMGFENAKCNAVSGGLPWRSQIWERHSTFLTARS
jgi:hypothetical protein